MKRDSLFIYPYKENEETSKFGRPVVDNNAKKAVEFKCEYQNKSGFTNKSPAGPNTDSYIDRVYVPKQGNMDMLLENLSARLCSPRLLLDKKVNIKKIRRFGTHYAIDLQFNSGDANE